MEIVVLSDTHMPSPGRNLPQKVVDCIKRADLIFHAGDIAGQEFFDELLAMKEVRAVCGNMDHPELRAKLPSQRIEEIEGVRIGIIHGTGGPNGIEKRVQLLFGPDAELDVLVFGHSHVPMNRRDGNLLLLNPGSATDMASQLGPTFGILSIEKNREVKVGLVRCG